MNDKTKDASAQQGTKSSMLAFDAACYGGDWPAPAAQVDERAALARLEAACDALCRLRTQDHYLSMVDSGQQDALQELDDARTQARAALSRQRSAGDAEDAERYQILRDHNGFPLDGKDGIGRFQVSRKERAGEAHYYGGASLDQVCDAARAQRAAALGGEHD